MNECILGLIICILLYGLGQLLYPEPATLYVQKIPEPNRLLEESE